MKQETKALKADKIPCTTQGGDSRFDAILDAAESVFATSGYDGATMRQIARKADVAQALIHYHFNDKARLFETMAARRSAAINGARSALLAGIFAQRAQPSLEPVVEALFRPIIQSGLEMADQGGGFSRILVSLANSVDPRDQALAKKLYDPIAQEFIAAFQRVEPRLGREDAVWGYMFAIGVGMTMMARTGRSLRLSGGKADDSDIDQLLAKITTFICAGIRALLNNNTTKGEDR